ncbi:sodium:calcium antiporter [Candidatus Woesearchaeota archaeon]|nr:sodium:calcium antiporter [Candidatus Woesearchaeota archaeon]
MAYQTLVHSTLFLLACIILVLSGGLVVRCLIKIASFLRLSEFVVGSIIMASATTLPELFVGIEASLQRNTALALGNVIGSNIVDLTLIMGMGILLARNIHITSKKTLQDGFVMVLIATLPMILMLLGRQISQLDGMLLLLVFAFYQWHLFRQGRRFTKQMENHIERWHVVVSVLLFLASVTLLFFSARYVVRYATYLSLDLQLPPILIGLFLIAVGTSLPELVFVSRASLQRHPEMGLGDVMGAVVANSTAVLGVSALIYPLSSDFLLFISSGVYMILTCFLFFTFMESGHRLDWREGISLIMLYAFFIIVEFYVKGFVA